MGIVSATGRTTNLKIEDYEDFIQTDAAINPGQLRRRPGERSRRTGRYQYGDPGSWLGAAIRASALQYR